MSKVFTRFETKRAQNDLVPFWGGTYIYGLYMGGLAPGLQLSASLLCSRGICWYLGF